VEMQDRAVCIIPNDKGAERLELAEALIGRQSILEACRRHAIYGFAVGRGSREDKPLTE